MAANGLHTTSELHPKPAHSLYGDDRRCRHCHDVALAFDPVAGQARCRSCGELA